MLDIKLIRDQHEEVEKKLKTKDPEISLKHLLNLDEKLRHLKTEVEQLKSQRNLESKKIGLMKQKGEDTTALMEEIAGVGGQISKLDDERRIIEEEYTFALASLPNLPMDGIKSSLDPAENVQIKSVGEKPTFSFPFKNHVELNEKLKLFDFKRGAKIAGTGWPVYRGLGAQLEWALINFMLDVHRKNGFEQWMPPHLVRPEIMFGSGQLPKFKDQAFKLQDDDYQLYLIPTSEVPLNGLHFDEILENQELPKKYVAYTPCFRREAGAAGSQERGLIRVHQFNKVEMYCFCKPEESEELFEAMMTSAEEILQALGLHYRNMLLVTGDISYASAKTVDVEVWLPGQDRYYEVSSISNCLDFQARRSKIRYRDKEGKPTLVHTLNGSGLATSRLMVALLENNQKEDGSITLPLALHPYMNGIKELSCQN